MKTSKLFLLVIALIAISSFQFNLSAQTSNKRKITLEFQENGTLKKYDLQGFSFSINRDVYNVMKGETEEGQDSSQSIYIYLTMMKSPDATLLKWVADPAMSKDVKIIAHNPKTGKPDKEITLKKALITSMSDSYYNYMGYGEEDDETDGSNASASLSISCSQVIIDGVTMK